MKNRKRIIKIGEIELMDNILKLIELGVPIGFGIYIGFEGLNLLVEAVSDCFIWFIDMTIGGDEK